MDTSGRNMRDRTNEVKHLREEIERLRKISNTEGGQDNLANPESEPITLPSQQTGLPTPLSETEALAGGTPKITSPQPHSEMPSAALSEPDWMGSYFDGWQEASGLNASGDFIDLEIHTSRPEESLSRTRSTSTPSALASISPHSPLASSSYRVASFLEQQPQEQKQPQLAQFSPSRFDELSEYSPPSSVNSTSRASVLLSRRIRRASTSEPGPSEPLVHLAVAGGQIEVLRFLLTSCQLSVNVRDSAGYTALQRAVMSGRTDMVALLIRAGANVNENEVEKGH